MILDMKSYVLNTQAHSAYDLLMQLSKPVYNGYELIILQLSRGILDGLTFLHEMVVSQRYFTPSNILVSNPKDDFGVLQVKISDFGESSGNIVQATQSMKTPTVNIYKG